MLALGIGASTAVFTVVRPVLIQPLPYREPDRLVLLRADAPGYRHYPGITGNEFHALRDRTDIFEGVAAINGVNANLTDSDDMERVAGGSATDNFLSTLGVTPAAGRPLSLSLDMGNPYVRSVIISDELWQRRWKRDPSVLGHHISVNNIDVEVVGITPRGFRTYLGADTEVASRIDIWFVNSIMRNVALGFNPSNVLTMKLELSFRDFDTPAKRLTFYQQARDALRSIPGVRGVGLGYPVPLDGPALIQRVTSREDGAETATSQQIVFSGYFETLRIPIRAGRDFDASDDVPGARPQVIVEQRLADQLWPGINPIGRRLKRVPGRPGREWAEVIGVVDHVQTAELRQNGLPQLHESFGDRGYGAAFFIRTNGDPLAVAVSAKAAVEQLGPKRPVFAARTLDSLVADASADTRFALFVLAAFAITAVVLTAIGVYGVVAYATARRTREIAVRLALGADAGRIVALVLREGAAWTTVGVAAGLAGALGLSRYLSALLFNVGTRDPLTFAAVAALLAIVALAATALPAIRAVRVDPMLALRSE